MNGEVRDLHVFGRTVLSAVANKPENVAHNTLNFAEATEFGEKLERLNTHHRCCNGDSHLWQLLVEDIG